MSLEGKKIAIAGISEADYLVDYSQTELKAIPILFGIIPSVSELLGHSAALLHLTHNPHWIYDEVSNILNIRDRIPFFVTSTVLNDSDKDASQILKKNSVIIYQPNNYIALLDMLNDLV